MCVVCEVERDLRVGERGEEEKKLSGSAANRRTFVSTRKSTEKQKGYKWGIRGPTRLNDAPELRSGEDPEDPEEPEDPEDPEVG